MSAPRLSSQDKDAIVRAFEEGERAASIAERFGVHESYPGKLARRRAAARFRAAMADQQRLRKQRRADERSGEAA